MAHCQTVLAQASMQLFPTSEAGVPQAAQAVVADWEAALACAASCAQAASGAHPLHTNMPPHASICGHTRPGLKSCIVV